MSLKYLAEKANENFETAEWAERKKYLDTAVSLFYYSAFQRIVYISKKEGFYRRPRKKENFHNKIIEDFILNVSKELAPADKRTFLIMKRLRRIRNKADYDADKLEPKAYMLGFRYYYNGIIDIINKFL